MICKQFLEKQKEDVKMIGMQYKITLPSDYDMELIKERISKNGSKTDGFHGLQFKCYLIQEKGINNNFANVYAPLYLWNKSLRVIPKIITMNKITWKYP